MSEPQPTSAVSEDRVQAVQKSKEYWWLPHAVLVIVSCLAGVWGLLVLDEVPEPYLVGAHY